MDPQQAPPNNANNPFAHVVERLQSANNVLVTVSNNPTVDQLAACLGLTLILNKMGKHATAVFSGEVPSTIAFLQPEKTLEKNTDSLRDFIIALDKSKADKLRYKVEDEMVKIFITPYKTSINEADFSFSQGDFNVDAIVALGVHDRVQLDQTILAHGRILHDAVVMSFNTQGGHQLGSIPWVEPNASSLCEMVGDVGYKMQPNIFDAQISTSLLTGIVAETNRFSNQKASPHTMSIAGVLMAAGASQQLVSAKLEEAARQKTPQANKEAGEPAGDKKPGDGLIEIPHEAAEPEPQKEEQAASPPSPEEPELPDVPGAVFEEPENNGPSGRIMHEPPKLGGQLTANSVPEYKQYSDTTDPLTRGDEKEGRILNRTKGKFDSEDKSSKTLSEIEKEVDSPHLKQPAENNDNPLPPALDEARDAVTQAEGEVESKNPSPHAREDMGANELGASYHEEEVPPESATLDPDKDGNDNPPPPVPPPIMPPAA